MEERLEAPCQDGEGFGEWFEILLKIRRTKVVGTLQGNPCIKAAPY